MNNREDEIRTEVSRSEKVEVGVKKGIRTMGERVPT